MNKFYLILVMLMPFARAQENEQAEKERIDFLDSYIEKLQWGDFKLGGWMRWDYRYQNSGEEDMRAGDFNFESTALALFQQTDYRIWQFRTQLTRYEYSPRNPAGQDRSVVQMGHFDGTRFVAARAKLLNFHVAYTLQA